MSYILDALKKAQSQRQIGSVPDVHVQPLAAVRMSSADVNGRRSSSLWSVMAALIAVVLIIGLTLSVAWRYVEAKRSTHYVEQLSPSPVKHVDDTSPLFGRMHVDSKSHAMHFQVPQTGSDPDKLQQPSKAPRQARQNEHSPSARHDSLQLKKTELLSALPMTAADRIKSKVMQLNDLPPSVRNELPAFDIAGYIYADDANARSVWANKKEFREGDEIAPGFTIEKMLPGKLRLNYKGYRYEISV